LSVHSTVHLVSPPRAHIHFFSLHAPFLLSFKQTLPTRRSSDLLALNNKKYLKYPPLDPSNQTELLAPPFFLRSIRPSLLILSSRSEEHTSQLQSRFDLVCRLLLEKKKITILTNFYRII